MVVLRIIQSIKALLKLIAVVLLLVGMLMQVDKVTMLLLVMKLTLMEQVTLSLVDMLSQVLTVEVMRKNPLNPLQLVLVMRDMKGLKPLEINPLH